VRRPPPNPTGFSSGEAGTTLLHGDPRKEEMTTAAIDST
jgi:hypothetical protein